MTWLRINPTLIEDTFGASPQLTLADLLVRYSVTTGAHGDSTAQISINDSIGTWMSTTAIPPATHDNLFDDIAGPANQSLQVDYRCFFFYNTHPTQTLFRSVIWIKADVLGGANVQLGLDPTATSADNSVVPQAVTPVDRFTSPPGVVFSFPSTKGTGLLMGDLGPGQCHAVWVRRNATASSTLLNDGLTVALGGDRSA
jgi:hypothetical protein